MSTLTFTFTESNSKSSLRTGFDVEAAGGGLETGGSLVLRAPCGGCRRLVEDLTRPHVRRLWNRAERLRWCVWPTR